MAAAPIVFFDIAGPDPDKQRSFYADIFGWDSDPRGNLEVPVISTRLKGLLRTDPADCMIYFGVPDVAATLAKIEAAGGVVHMKRTEVKGVVVLGLFADPAGNHLGVVEMDGDTTKIP